MKTLSRIVTLPLSTHRRDQFAALSSSAASDVPANEHYPTALANFFKTIVALALQREIHLATLAHFEVGNGQGLGTSDQTRDADPPRGFI